MSGLKPTNPSKYREFLWSVKLWPSKRAENIARSLSDAVELILYRSKTYYLTGGALNVQTGRLRSSVSKSPVFRSGNTFRVLYGTNVFYGAIWETGRKTKKGFDRRAFLEPAGIDERSKVVDLLTKAGVKMK